MRTRIDDGLLLQIEAFRLKYNCESCSHFDDQAERCSLGYPEQPHRQRRLQLGQELLFCKEFDLV